MINLLAPLKTEITIEDNIVISDKTSFNDVSLKIVKNNDSVDIILKADKTPIKHIYLYYSVDIKSTDLIYGDTLERGYADLSWSKANDKPMFWYFFVNDVERNKLFALGSKVHPRGIVIFKFIGNGIVKVDLNVCNGANGVILNGRELLITSLIQKDYSYSNLLDCCRDFCVLMMNGVKKIPLNEKVFGFNNWYYAYGKSSYNQILDDVKLLKKVTKNLQIKPFMVIDDCWQINPCGGPWLPNSDFKDMEKLASEIKKSGIRPGIWIRPLADFSDYLKECRHPMNKDVLDFTYPEVKEHVKEVIGNIVKWGYELIKYDYVTWDIYLLYAFQMDETLCAHQNWNFHNRSLTNAEIVMDLYKTILDASGGTILLGCNAISHLVAGYVHINRVGDDTSGREWDRTKRFGVNTLAFRAMQDKVFYIADYDCVGIIGEQIPWKQNKEWLRLLSFSNTPLFVSCNPYLISKEIEEDLINAFAINVLDNKCEPINWLDELYPTEWNVNGEKASFDWSKL